MCQYIEQRAYLPLTPIRTYNGILLTFTAPPPPHVGVGVGVGDHAATNAQSLASTATASICFHQTRVFACFKLSLSCMFLRLQY
jgi:hypothetical protein